MFTIYQTSFAGKEVKKTGFASLADAIEFVKGRYTNPYIEQDGDDAADVFAPSTGEVLAIEKD